MTGAFGLGGAIIGGLFTAWLALREQKREDEKMRRERAEARQQVADESEAEARVAARILQAETQTCLIRLSRAMKTGRWWPENLALPLQPWQEYRERVARYMPLESWHKVSVWFQTAAAQQASAANAHIKHPGTMGPPIESSTTRGNIELAMARANEALTALQDFTGARLPPTPEDAADAGQ